MNCMAKLELHIESDGELAFQMSSLFHGVLMELLPENYAEYLPQSRLHPFSQHLEKRQEKWYWIICCLNGAARDIIINKTLWNLKQFSLKRQQQKIEILDKKYAECTYKELMDSFYREENNKYIQVRFCSPTAFKSQGQYVFYPDLKYIFQSLMNRYDAALEEAAMRDQETLEQICNYARIIRYDLRSVSFPLEGVKIPAFMGEITIKMNGTQTMANFARMLFLFGTYAGVGIKTSLGMGSIQIIQRKGGSTC